MRRVIQRIANRFDRVHFCYEAGPTGYGLYRLIRSLGHECTVVAPSLIPRKPSDRVKTNRRDALGLARLLRAGELTAVWVPDEGHEAMRDLVRARAAAVETLRVHRQHVSAFMLKHGRIFPRKKGWTMRYLCWLQAQQFDHPAHQIALQEMVEAVRISKERAERLERVIEEFVPAWSLAPIVRALQTLRGVDLIVAVTFATEVGDVSRFESPRQLMGYLGLVPGERSTGETKTRHTKAFLKAQPNKSDRIDARGIAQMMRVNLFRPVHVKTMTSQKRRALLTARKLLQEKAIAIDNDIRGLLRNFGLKVGMVGAVKFEQRIRELVDGMPDLAEIIEPLLDARSKLRRNPAALHRKLLVIVRNDQVCRRLMSIPGVGPVVALAYTATIDIPASKTPRKTLPSPHSEIRPMRRDVALIGNEGAAGRDRASGVR
ncbi:Transposase [Mesorhizobium muleiense]|uniref:Transposase n=1 Tax=Mesorhizobium muleiense TaxID=1004279 RepID=A0A1G9DP55_9HYPH|nr:Transposase [Mesorhizobium muleiense]